MFCLSLQCHCNFSTNPSTFLRQHHLSDKLLPLRTPGPSHSIWITQESDVDAGDEINHWDFHGYSNMEHLERFGSPSCLSARSLGYTLLPQTRSTVSLEWDTPVECGSTQNQWDSSLSPAVISALEGVTYIAEHLRAEDADFSASIGFFWL